MSNIPDLLRSEAAFIREVSELPLISKIACQETLTELSSLQEKLNIERLSLFKTAALNTLIENGMDKEAAEKELEKLALSNYKPSEVIKDSTTLAGDFIGDTVGSVAGAVLAQKYLPKNFRVKVPFSSGTVGPETFGGHLGGIAGGVGGYFVGKGVGTALQNMRDKQAEVLGSSLEKEAEILEKLAEYIEGLEASQKPSETNSLLQKIAASTNISEEEMQHLKKLPESVLKKMAGINDEPWSMGKAVGPAVQTLDPVSSWLLS